MANFNIFDGDPKLFLDENGSRLEFKGGQPEMDQGFSNFINISLFTKKGWCGNTLFDNVDEQIGSDVEIEAEKPITLQSLNNLRDEVLKAVSSSAFGDTEVNVEVINPSGYQRKILIEIKPPGQDIKQFIFTKNGLNWLGQALTSDK